MCRCAAMNDWHNEERGHEEFPCFLRYFPGTRMRSASQGDVEHPL